jgi:hypothetical protein
MLIVTQYVLLRSGFAVGNVAVHYAALGRHKEAVDMLQRLLHFNRRVLPDNHPDLGEAQARVQCSCALLFDCDAIIFCINFSNGHG